MAHVASDRYDKTRVCGVRVVSPRYSPDVCSVLNCCRKCLIFSLICPPPMPCAEKSPYTITASPSLMYEHQAAAQQPQARMTIASCEVGRRSHPKHRQQCERYQRSRSNRHRCKQPRRRRQANTKQEAARCRPNRLLPNGYVRRAWKRQEVTEPPTDDANAYC